MVHIVHFTKQVELVHLKFTKITFFLERAKCVSMVDILPRSYLTHHKERGREES